MMDGMVREMETDLAEAKRDEQEAQKDYEAERADRTTHLEDLKGSKRTKVGALDLLETRVVDLHKTCSPLTGMDLALAPYKTAKEDRAKEGEGLANAKMILAGAKIGFLQGS